MRTPLLAALLCAGVALAETNPALEKANRLLFDQKFSEAAKQLEAAQRISGNSLGTTLRIYEVQGIVHAQLGQASKARDAFQALLSLDPKHELAGKFSSSVQSAFSAAQEWAKENSPLEFKAAKAALDDKGTVMQLAAKMKSDALKLSRKVRFHLRADEGRWTEQDSALQGAYAAANTEAKGVEWWAELLGDNDRVLAMIGSDAEPVREGKAKDKVPDAPKVVTKDPTPVVTPPPANPDSEPKNEVVRGEPVPSSGPLRPLGYVLMGTGVAAVGVGVIFGAMSSGARSKISGAQVNTDGLVTNLSQKDAFALDSQARSQALIANVMFGVGGAVAVAGGLCWLLGGSSSSPDSASAQLSPTVGGVVLSGGF